MSTYDLSIPEIIAKIQEEKAKRVLIQLADGLKPEVKEIQEKVRAALPNVELVFWGGSAYGACDVPLSVEKLGFDLLIHLGHDVWK